MLNHTQQKGTSTELHCIFDLTNLGIRCLKPVDESAKYDVVADLDGRFVRIQCKSAKWVAETIEPNTAFAISTCRQSTNTKANIRYKYSKNEIDYFYTWFNGQGYLVPIEETKGISFRWRYEYPKTGQKQGVHIADNYKIKDMLKNEFHRKLDK